MRAPLAFTQEHFEQYPYAGDLFTHPFVQDKVAKYRANPSIAPFVLVVSVKNDLHGAMPKYIDDKAKTPLDALEMGKGSCSDRAAVAYAITSQLLNMYSSYNGTTFHASMSVYSPRHDSGATFDNNSYNRKNIAKYALSKQPLVPPFSEQRETVIARHLRAFGDTQSKRLLFVQIREHETSVYNADSDLSLAFSRTSILAQHIGLSALQTIDTLCTPAQLRAE